MATSQKAKIQYASKHARSANYYKNAIGQNGALENLGIVAQKKELEDEFTAWVNASADRKEKYGEALKLIEENYQDIEASKARQYMVEALLMGPEIFLFANRAQPLAGLLEDAEANKEKIAKVTEAMKKALDGYFKDYSADTDQKVVAALLKIYADNTTAKFYPSIYSDIQGKYKGNFAKYTAKMFQKSVFDNKAEMEAFLNKPSLKVLEKDMAFQAATAIFDKFREISKEQAAGGENLSKGRRLFVEGLMEMNPDKKFYPDANSTMRLSYGKVMDYDPRDGVHTNITLQPMVI